MEENTYLEPIIEEEDVLDMEEDAGLIADVNNTCASGCNCAEKVAAN